MIILNNHIFRALLIGLIVIGLGFSTGSAQNINSGAGTSSFSFLKINVGGRAVAMGGAFTGLANDEAALYYNPAGIAGIEDPRFIAEYHNYFVGLQSGFGGYVRPIGGGKVVALHFAYLNYGEFTQTDQAGNVEGTFGGGDFMLAGSLAMLRTNRLMVGATAKFIYEKIQNFSATGLALDLGLRYNSDRDRFSAGLLVQNLGAQLSTLGVGDNSSLPTTLRAGVGARPRGLNSILTADLILPFDNDLEIAIGAEYIEMKPLYLRIGWNSFGSNYRSDLSKSGLAGMTFGIGLDIRSMQFSYAFVPAADLGDSHRVTLTGGL